MAGRSVVMIHGVFGQIGTPTEIYRAPSSLFVADFIGETNRIHSTLSAPGSFTLGDTSLLGMTDGLAPGQAIVVTIRPEDIIPHAPGSRSAVSGGGLIEVTIGEMEFLGTYWSTRLTGIAPVVEETYAGFALYAVSRRERKDGG